jgi:hypothetical protein
MAANSLTDGEISGLDCAFRLDQNAVTPAINRIKYDTILIVHGFAPLAVL